MRFNSLLATNGLVHQFQLHCGMLLMSFFACKAITAPADFDALTSFFYEHFHSESAYLEEGMVQLNQWLEIQEQRDALDKGYRIDNLSEPALNTVTMLNEDPNLFGISKSIEFKYPVDDMAYVNFAVHPRDVFSNPDAVNEREYTGDPECFLRHECEFLRHDSILERALPLNLDIVIYFANEVRWVETTYGAAFLQKRWLTQEPEINQEWLQLNAGYALAITLPMADGRAKQIETVWGDVILGELPIPEDGAFMVAVDVLENILKQFEEYLDENGTEPQ